MIRFAVLALSLHSAWAFVPTTPLSVAGALKRCAPALRMSMDASISRRSFGGLAAAGIATLVVPKDVHAVEYLGPRNDGKWASHEGPFKEEEFATGFTTDPETGLKYKDLVVGKGNAPKEGDIVVSDYKGYVFETGEKWGDSWEEGIPRAARAGATPGQKFMAGLNEGIKDMKPGGKRIIYIPSKMGYNFMAIKSRYDPSKEVVPSFSNLVVFTECLETRAPPAAQ